MTAIGGWFHEWKRNLWARHASSEEDQQRWKCFQILRDIGGGSWIAYNWLGCRQSYRYIILNLRRKGLGLPWRSNDSDSTAGGPSSIPGPGTKVLSTSWEAWLKKK